MSLEPSSPDPAADRVPVSGDVVKDDGPDAVRRRIPAERAELGRTVEELSARLDWKTQVRRRVDKARESVGGGLKGLLRKVRGRS